MDEEIFRKKNLNKLSSPDELNDYIKVTNPGVWTFLVAIIILLIGLCIWGFLGKLETKIDVVAISDDGSLICYVKEEDISKVKVGEKVYIDGNEYTVSLVNKEPITVKEDEFSEYALHVGNLATGQWVYEILFSDSISDGVYSAQIVVDSVSPFYFVFN